MAGSLVRFALTQRFFMLAMAGVLVVAGVFAMLRLPIDAFPDISTTQVKMILKAPGMTPEEVEQRVIAPIEMEMLGIPKQKMLRSVAKYAIADITIDFDDTVDVYWARQQVTERLAGVMGDLPESVSGGLAPISTPLSDVFMFTIEGGDLSAEQRRTLLDWTIRPALRNLSGVADVNTLGGRVRTFEVVPDDTALVDTGLTVTDIVAAIEASNRNDGAGRIDVGEEALIVRAVGAIDSIDSLKEVVVARGETGIVTLGAVADVRFGSLTRYGAVTKDGVGEAVEGIVLSLRGADANAIIRDVRARLDELKPSLPDGVSIVPFYDRSELIQRSTHMVQKSLLEATVLVLVLLVLFLGDVRAAIVVAVALPLSALFTFLVMGAVGMSANLMSLGGLAIAIGLIVDAAVVVVENTAEQMGHGRGSKVPVVHLIYRAASEVAMPVASGILIICLVFLPLVALEGLEGKLFRPVALTIIFALGGSLLLSLTVIPVLAAMILKPHTGREPLLMRIITPAYERLLGGALRVSWPVYAVAGAGLAAAAVAYMGVGKTFMPTMDEGSVIMQTAKLPSVNLQRSIEGDLNVQKALMEDIPEIDHIVARVGSDELGLDPMGLNEADMFLALKPKSEWREPDKDWLIDQMRQTMHSLPGIEPAFTQPIEMRTSEMLTGARGDLAVKIFGPDLGTLASLAGQVETALRGVEGASEVFTLSNDTTDFMQLKVDRYVAGAAGLSISETEDNLRAMLEGVRAGVVIEAGRRTPLLVRGGEDLRQSPDAFADMQIAAGDGGSIRVGDFARVVNEPGPVKIERENASRFALVQAFVEGRDLVGFVEDAQDAVAAAVELPDGYRIAWGGEFENQRRAAARLGLVVPAALGLIFLVLFATLRSIRQAALIFANVPFALVGGVLALTAAGEYLSVPASVGFIALLGIAVLNGLVLVSYFNQLVAAGASVEEAVRKGAARRLRPVLMTATIAAFGLVPLLFADGPGSEIQRPLAIVVIGGLITSTALTLVLLPVLYRRFGVSSRVQNREGGLQWKMISAD